MFLFDDIQDALDFYETDDTQWMITDETQYAVGYEEDIIEAVQRQGWRVTSPEELTRKLAQA